MNEELGLGLNQATMTLDEQKAILAGLSKTKADKRLLEQFLR
jgi:hypothetical protein